MDCTSETYLSTLLEHQCIVNKNEFATHHGNKIAELSAVSDGNPSVSYLQQTVKCHQIASVRVCACVRCRKAQRFMSRSITYQ